MNSPMPPNPGANEVVSTYYVEIHRQYLLAELNVVADFSGFV